MTNFKRYKNRETGDEVEAELEELSIIGSNQWHKYWRIKGESELSPEKDFFNKFEEIIT